MQIFSLALLLLIALALSKCRHFSNVNGTDPIESKSVCKEDCGWYAEKNCCPSQSPGNPWSDNKCLKKDFSGIKYGCGSNNMECYDLYHLMDCGRDCSPDQHKYLIDKTDLDSFQVCETFVKDQLWDACKDAGYLNSTSLTCKTYDDYYDGNSTKWFTEQFGAQYVLSTSADDCWNSATSASLTLATGILAFSTNNRQMFMLFVLMSIIPFASAKCNDQDNDEPIKVDSMCRCEQYTESTCCPTGFSNVNYVQEYYDGTIYSAVFGCPEKYDIKEQSQNICEPSDGCRDAYEELFCAQACSPLQFEYTDETTGDMAICKPNADKLWNACKGAQVWVSESQRNGSCEKVSDQWTDAEEFINQLSSGSFVYHDNVSDSCWNGVASSLLYPAFAISAVISKRPILVLAILAIISTPFVSAGKCNGGVPSTQLENACFCEMYSDTCCPDQSVPADPFSTATSFYCAPYPKYNSGSICPKTANDDACGVVLSNWFCAQSCHPNQYDITDSDSRLYICEPKAQEMWDICKPVYGFNYTTNKCFVIGDQYKNFTDWIFDGDANDANLIIPVPTSDEDQLCYNGSSLASVSLGFLLSIFFFGFGQNPSLIIVSLVAITLFISTPVEATRLVTLVAPNSATRNSIYLYDTIEDRVDSYNGKDICEVQGFDYTCHVNSLVEPNPSVSNSITGGYKVNSTIYYSMNNNNLYYVPETAEDVVSVNGTILFNHASLPSNSPVIFRYKNGSNDFLYVLPSTGGSQNGLSYNYSSGNVTVGSFSFTSSFLKSPPVYESSGDNFWFLKSECSLFFCDASNCTNNFNNSGIDFGLEPSGWSCESPMWFNNKMYYWTRASGSDVASLKSITLPADPSFQNISNPFTHWSLTTPWGTFTLPSSMIVGPKLYILVNGDVEDSLDLDYDVGIIFLTAPTAVIDEGTLISLQMQYDPSGTNNPVLLGTCDACGFDTEKSDCCKVLFENGASSFQLLSLFFLVLVFFV